MSVLRATEAAFIAFALPLSEKWGVQVRLAYLPRDVLAIVEAVTNKFLVSYLSEVEFNSAAHE